MSEASEYQLEYWSKGVSVHNEVDDECCPDFSCCNKKMNTPKEVRERFVKAVNDKDDKTKMEMLGMFLGQAMATMDKKVYIAGLEVPTSEN